MAAAIAGVVLDRLKGLRWQDQLAFRCPDTGIPLPRHRLRCAIVVPDDTDAVLEVLDGTLNRVDCACGGSHGLLAPLVAAFRPAGAMVCVTGGANNDAMRGVLADLGPPFDTATLVDDYNGLLRHLLGWLDRLLGDYANAVISGAFARLDRSERIARRLPVLLVYLRMLGEGTLPATLTAPDGTRAPPEDARAFHAWLHANAVIAQLDDLMGEHGPGQLIAAATPRIPARAVGAGVLDELAGRAARTFAALRAAPPSERSEKFAPAYGAGMHNAVAHALAGRPNPHPQEWASLVRMAWRGWDGAGDNPLLPPQAEAPRVIGFEALWDQSMPAVAAAQGFAEGMRAMDDVHAMFARLGHERRFAALLTSGRAIRVALPQKDRAPDASAVQATFNSSPEASRLAGGARGGAVTTLAVQGEIEEAARVAAAFLDQALAAKDFIAAFAFGAEAIRGFTHAQALREAGLVAARLTEVWHRPEAIAGLRQADPRRLVSFWNECGSLMRAIGKPEQALRSYEIARGFLTLVQDEAGRAADATVLDGNEGRALRDLGRFAEALPRIEAAAAAEPDDSGVRVSLALLHLQSGRPAQAAAAATQALALADPVAAPVNRMNALLIRAEARRIRGMNALALADLAEAMAIAPPAMADARMRIAAAAALVPDARTHQPALVGQAETLLQGAIDAHDGSAFSALQLMPAALAGLGMLLLAEGRRAELDAFDQAHLAPFLDALDDDVTIDWRLCRLKALVERQREGGWSKACWPWLRRAYHAVEGATPAGDDAGFAAGWLADKDAFQLELVDAVTALVDQGTLPPDALPDAYDFANGRDLAARLGAPAAPRPALLQAAARIGRPILLVMLLDTPDAVHVATWLTLEERVELHGSWPAATVEAAARDFARAMDAINPAAPALDGHLAPFFQLLRDIGQAIAERLATDALVVFLPGRRMSSLPLHLLPVGAQEQPLLERHPVLYAANLALLLADGGARARPGKPLLVACAKAGDGRDFRLRLAMAARHIAHDLAGAVRLSGRRATPARALDRLADASELFLLCHGARIGRAKGYGLYLSDGRDLPPAIAIDVEDAPEIARFALAWGELGGAGRTPALIVSLACSSARTVIASGGVRVGPEAAAFATGTRAVIAPLWNVDQQAALQWVEHFQAARRLPGNRIWDAARAACLALRADHPHVYFWGAFMLTGCLQGDRDDG